jgi:hypothetical protein
MQEMIANPSHRPAKNKETIIETHLKRAWRAIDGEMTIEEFIAAAQEAAAAIGLRDRLEARIQSGEITPRSFAL